MELFPSNRVIGTVGLILGSEIGLKINSNRVPSARKRLQRVHCQGSREKKKGRRSVRPAVSGMIR